MNKIATTVAGATLTLGFIATSSVAAQAAPAAPAAPAAVSASQASGAICAKSYAENDYYVRINNCTNMQMMTTVHYKDGRTTHLRVGPYSFQRLLSDVTSHFSVDYYYM